MPFTTVHDDDFAVAKVVKEMCNLYYDMSVNLKPETDQETIEYRRNLLLLYMTLVIDIGHDEWLIRDNLVKARDTIANSDICDLKKNIAKYLAFLSTVKTHIRDTHWCFSKSLLDNQSLLESSLNCYDAARIEEKEFLTIQ